MQRDALRFDFHWLGPWLSDLQFFVFQFSRSLKTLECCLLLQIIFYLGDQSSPQTKLGEELKF